MSIKCILTEQEGKGGSSVYVGAISITTPPIKTSYYAGDSFDTTGMVVTAQYYIDNVPFSEADVTGSITVSPSVLTDGTTNVVITYADGNGNIVTNTQAITVIHKLVSIGVTTLPSVTSYKYGSTLNTSGMVVTATYSDGNTATVTPTNISPTALNTVTNS